MRATLMYGAGDVRIEQVPDARLIEPTDANVTVTRACRVFDRVIDLSGAPGPELQALLPEWRR
jgi:hypothetical protein